MSTPNDPTASSDMAEANARLLLQDIDHLRAELRQELDRPDASGRWERVRLLENLRTVLMRTLNQVRGLPADDARAILTLEHRLLARRR